jgi:hypothetical protein
MPLTQAYLLSLLTLLNEALPTRPLLELLQARFGPAFRSQDAFRFLLKGGAVAPLLLYKHDGRPPYHTFPFPIENDIDSEILINPNLPLEDFHGMQRFIVRQSVNILTERFSLSTPMREAMKEEWVAQGYMLVDSPPTRYFTSMTEEDLFPSQPASSFAALFSEKGAFLEMDKKSPFRIAVFTEYFFQREPLHMTLIQVTPNVEGGQSVLDIVIPKRANPMLRFDWVNALPELFDTSIPYLDKAIRLRLPLLYAPFLYLDQRISANRVRNTAPEKHASRTRRANVLRNRLLKPLRTTPMTNAFRGDPLFKNTTTLYGRYTPATILANTRGWGGGGRQTRRHRRK